MSCTVTFPDTKYMKELIDLVIAHRLKDNYPKTKIHKRSLITIKTQWYMITYLKLCSAECSSSNSIVLFVPTQWTFCKRVEVSECSMCGIPTLVEIFFSFHHLILRLLCLYHWTLICWFFPLWPWRDLFFLQSCWGILFLDQSTPAGLLQHPSTLLNLWGEDSIRSKRPLGQAEEDIEQWNPCYYLDNYSRLWGVILFLLQN